MIGNPRYVNVLVDAFFGIGTQCWVGGGILVAIGCVKWANNGWAYSVWPTVYSVGGQQIIQAGDAAGNRKSLLSNILLSTQKLSDSFAPYDDIPICSGHYGQY